MKQILEFEKPIVNLKQKIAELKEITKDSDMDLSEEIQTLETGCPFWKTIFTVISDLGIKC